MKAKVYLFLDYDFYSFSISYFKFVNSEEISDANLSN